MFKLDKSQEEKLKVWMESLPQEVIGDPDAYTGAIGGRYTYKFTPTGLGVIVVVKDFITKKEINLTDFENW